MSRTKESYLLVDHSASPGLPEDVARFSGYDPALVKEGKRFEAATLTCSHCKVSVVKNPLRLRERAYCPKCDHYICDLCEGRAREPGYDHMPFEKLVDTHYDASIKGQLLTSSPLGTAPKLLLP